jgi:hypothetical protein
MQPGMAAHPGDLSGRAEEKVNGESFQSQHEQNGESDFEQDRAVRNHGTLKVTGWR